MTYTPVTALQVSAWNRAVGVLLPPHHGPYASFQFDPGWLRDGPELAPILMPRRDGQRVYAFREHPPHAFGGLPPMLADSLPDAFGNALINAYLANQGTPASSVGSVDRLAYLGSRGMGALEFAPDLRPFGAPPTPLVLADLVAAARAALAGTMSASGTASSIQQLLAVGTSAGGAQAKATVDFNPETGEMLPHSGQTPSAFEPWLVKFDGVAASNASAGTGRVEYAYSLMAAAAGLTMAQTRLIEDGERAHFMTRRFDRTDDGARLHLQSLAALLGLDMGLAGVHSAAQYFLAIDSLGLGESARQQAFRRIAFNVLAANRDDHPKNFAFLMNAAGEWSLAPAYDVTFACDNTKPWLTRHHLGVEGKFAGIERSDLLALADRCSVPDAAPTLAAVEAAVAAWPEFAAQAGVPSAQVRAITQSLPTT
ncbi:MAG: type II toxin-antitoxin system HipA family toxin [Bifidobacteriaceae bacterium]|nr:type II toxin-antitoxin system HipA family toxin [Bifidobacteriaceae bacterium]